MKRKVNRAAIVERLEVRQLLAGIIVNTVADTVDANPAVTSLREAIAAANATPAVADTITFSLGVGAHTINLGGALPDLSTNMDISGPGASLLTVRRDTGGDYRIFTIPSGRIVALSGMTIANGHVTAASTFGNSGGGIYNAGNLTLTNCNLNSNATTGVGAAFGGGIFNDILGSLSTNNSTFNGNTSPGTLGFGGALMNRGTLSLSGSTFGANSSGINGGAITNEGNATISDTTFSGNTTTGFGGGMSSLSGKTLGLTHCTFNGNAAAYGGGIYSGSTLTVVDSTIDSNVASGSVPGGSPATGGGIYSFGPASITSSTISGNTATATGGGVYNSGTVNINNSSVTSNGAGRPRPPANGGGYEGYGGGLDNQGTANIVGSTFSGNVAGAIWTSSSCTIDASTISGNTILGGITGFGGTLHINTSTISGNCGEFSTGGVYSNNGGTIQNSTISGNHVTGYGGGILVQHGIFNITNCTITGNSAEQGGSGIWNQDVANVDHCTITGNTGGILSGGIYNSGTNAGPATLQSSGQVIFPITDLAIIDSVRPVAVTNLLLATLFFAAFAVLVIIAFKRSRFRNAAVRTIAALAAVELLIAAHHWRASGPSEIPYPSEWRAAALSAASFDHRVLTSSLPLSNAALIHHFRDAYGYDPTVLARYARFLAISQRQTETGSLIPDIRQVSPLFRLLRIQHVFYTQQSQPRAVEIPGAIPRLLLIHTCQIAKTPDEYAAALLSSEFNPAETVILENIPNPAPLPITNSESVNLVRQTNSQLEITAQLSSPAILLISDAYSPGWRASSLINSPPQLEYQLLPADLTLQAIPLAAGTHHLLVSYHTPLLPLGATISVVALALLIVLAFRRPAIR